MRKVILIFTIMMLCTLSGAYCQVTIGSLFTPVSGALLDLKENEEGTATKGLGLPRVELTEVNQLYPMFKNDPSYTNGSVKKETEDKDHIGLLVYNTSTVGDFYPGMHIWDGVKWKMLGKSPCSGITNLAIVGPTEVDFTGVTQKFKVLHNTIEGEVKYQWYVTMPSTPETIIGDNSAILKFIPNIACQYTLRCEVTELCQYPKTKSITHIFVCKKDIGEYTEDIDGTAVILGKRCYDVVKINNGGANGTLDSRYSQQTDFTKREEQDPALYGVGDQLPGGIGGVPPIGSHYRYTGVQTYTFQGSIGTAISDLEFIIDDFDNLIEKVEPASLSFPGNITNGEQKITIHFKSNLNSVLAGVSRDDAKRVTLHALFKANGVANRNKIEMTFQDASCCGAYMDNGKWLTFMCHNLGANDFADPLVPNVMLMGDYYQYANSAIAFYGGAAETTHPGKKPYAKGTWKGTTSSTGGDYYKPPYNNDWNNTGTESEPIRGIGDPCPEGWRLPTKTELEQVLDSNNNSIKHVGHYQFLGQNPLNGLQIGESLFLSSCGYTDWHFALEKPSVMKQGKALGYWTSSWSTTGTSTPYLLGATMFTQNSIGLIQVGLVVGRGYPVRCVTDK